METSVQSNIAPFRMYGNLYFVGCTKVCVHIIKTECGLVMIDTGYPEMYEQILHSMKQLDLDPKDIKPYKGNPRINDKTIERTMAALQSAFEHKHGAQIR